MTRRGLAIAAVAVLVVAAAAYGWCRADLRWRPRTLKVHEAEIAALVETAGWVSPGETSGRVLYLVGFRSCPDCIRFEREQFPLLRAAHVDTRVILYPRRSVSDAPERAGVAELWKTRSWATWERWSAVTPAAWTAAGIPPADTDPERAALVEKSRKLVDALGPLLADNGVRIAFPTLIWRDAKGRLRGCACERPVTYKYVRKELGA
ncbi:MAG TPA: hypothetical protein VL460_11195 [Caulobacteraceae bacterium]|jgi:hypothetical protein|nr:hypothetical protein [Caulobacteraceae bacterium]